MTNNFSCLLQRFYSDDRGAALVEYALLVGLISIAAITAMTAVGSQISSYFLDVFEKLGGDPSTLEQSALSVPQAKS